MVWNTMSECLTKNRSFVPDGTRSSEKTNPALKRWAILREKLRAAGTIPMRGLVY